MKKIIKIILSGLTLLSALFTSNTDHDLAVYAASIPESKVISNIFETIDEDTFYTLPYTNIESFDSSNIINNTYEHLNYNTLGTGWLNVEDVFDYASPLAYSAGLEDRLISSSSGTINAIKSDEIDHPYAGSDDYYKSYTAYYSTINTNFYFVNKNTLNQRITFYLDSSNINFQDLNDYLDLKGEIPYLVINNDLVLVSIRFNGKGKKVQVLTHNYATIELNRHPTIDYHSSSSRLFKVSLPLIDNINSIKILNSETRLLKDNYFDFSFDKTIKFHFDHKMKDVYRAYPFDIVSFSVKDGFIAVKNNYSLMYKDYDSSKSEAIAIQMYAEYTHTVKTLKTKSSKVGQSFPNLPGLILGDRDNIEIKIIDKGMMISEEITEEIHIGFDVDKKVVDGDLTYWYFNEDFSTIIDEYSSGTIKIKSFEWQLYDLEQKKDLNFFATNHYEDVNVHKYSFNASKAIRSFNYEMSGYMRSWSSKDANWLCYLGGIFTAGYAIYKEVTTNYQCYGFSFYFDKSRTMPIDNIKKVVIKYQCGYEQPNNSNDGWYPNTADQKKRVVVRTIELSKDRFLLGCALDDYGMALTNSANQTMSTDDLGNKFDYVIYKEHKVDDIDTYVTKMNPLEINYETEEQEVVRMVGNSMGLHVVLDEDGVYRVYDGDGNLADDYEPGIGDDGTMFPGKDLNKDGNIGTDEAVDSDLGVILQEMEPYEEPWWSTDEAKTGFTIGAIVALIVILIVIYAILKPRDFAFICKAIGQGFKNLFKSNKKSSKKKKKKKIKGKK